MRCTGYLYLTLILSFLLGTHNGFVALYKQPGQQLCRVFPYSTASLPSRDQAALEKGIPVDSPEQLQRLLEDYLS